MKRTVKKVLVTGATGQIGSELVVAFREKYGKNNVVAAGHKKKPDKELLESGPFEYLDVTKEESFQSTVKEYEVDAVYHLASLLSAAGEENPQLAWKVNMGRLYNVLETSRKRGVDSFSLKTRNFMNTSKSMIKAYISRIVVRCGSVSPVKKFDFGRDILKVIAIVTMTIDHISAILYPDLLFLHIIGRLSFPLFAYLIALGIESTKKPRKYMVTLLSFALISQIPYFLAFEIQPFERLNILFSLFLGALTIYFFNKRSLLTFVPILLSILFSTEGSYYVVLTVACMKLLKSNSKLGFLALFALNLQFLLIPDTQILSLFAVPLILLHVKNWLKKEILIPENSLAYSIRKYAFYIFYPLHLALLFLIKLFFF